MTEVQPETRKGLMDWALMEWEMSLRRAVLTLLRKRVW